MLVLLKLMIGLKSDPKCFFYQVNNINQPLEISAISSPEQSGRSPCETDLDQPPVLKRERPLELNNTGHYSSTPSSDEEGANFAPDTSSSNR